MSLRESISVLERRFKEIEENDKREAAEVAFAIASNYHKKNDKKKTRKWALKSKDLLKKCRLNTYRQCICRHYIIGGILMPTLIHTGVVKFRMKHFWNV